MSKTSPTLLIFSGLPGVGKTTLARLLAKEIARRFESIKTRDTLMAVSGRSDIKK